MNETTTISADYNADDHPDIPCANFSGYNYETKAGARMTWDGLPVHGHLNDYINTWIAVTMFLSATVGILLNAYCWRVIRKNSNVSRAALYYLGIDCFCRFYESLTELYKAYCVLSWACVNVDGYPWSGFLLNQIIASLGNGMIVSMTMLGCGLTTNRFFAVHFDGLLYKKAQRIALPHATLLFVFPLVLYLAQIGTLVNPKTDFVCYAGWYYTPLNYAFTWSYSTGAFTIFVKNNLYNFVYTVQGVTLFFDLIILLKEQNNPLKRRAAIRFSIMLITTHLTVIFYYLAKKLLTDSDALPLFCYLLLDLAPFLCYCIIAFFVIVFNLQPKDGTLQKITDVSTSTRNLT